MNSDRVSVVLLAIALAACSPAPLDPEADTFVPSVQTPDCRPNNDGVIDSAELPVVLGARARVRVGQCILDTEMKVLFDAEGEKVALTAMEYDLLHTFVSHPRRPLNRDQLLELAHHRKWDPFDRSVDNRIARLRKKIEADPAKPQVIRTVHGEGYVFVPNGG